MLKLNVYYPRSRFSTETAATFSEDVRRQLAAQHPHADITVAPNDSDRFSVGVDVGFGEDRNSFRDEAEDARRAVDLAIDALES